MAAGENPRITGGAENGEEDPAVMEVPNASPEQVKSRVLPSTRFDQAETRASRSRLGLQKSLSVCLSVSIAHPILFVQYSIRQQRLAFQARFSSVDA